MSLFTKSVCIVLLALSLANNCMANKWRALVGVTNDLDGGLDLTVYCPNFDTKHHTLRPGTTYQWSYYGVPPPSKSPFSCVFRWEGFLRKFDICVPDKDTGCEWVTWDIKQNGPCRPVNTGPIDYYCWKWN